MKLAVRLNQEKIEYGVESDYNKCKWKKAVRHRHLTIYVSLTNLALVLWNEI